MIADTIPHPLSLGGLTEAFKDIADVRERRNRTLSSQLFGFFNASFQGSEESGSDLDHASGYDDLFGNERRLLLVWFRVVWLALGLGS